MDVTYNDSDFAMGGDERGSHKSDEEECGEHFDSGLVVWTRRFKER